MDFDLLPPALKDLLPAYSKPRDGELLSSWIVRMAYDHYLKSHVFCNLVFPKTPIWNRDIDRMAPRSIVETLSRITPTSVQGVEQCLLTSYEGTIFQKLNPNGATKWILPHGIYHRKRKDNGLMYCPTCLSNDLKVPYFRKVWRLSLFVVCPKCGYMLEDCCPRCGSPIVFFRNDLGNKNADLAKPLSRCYSCSFDLKETTPTPVTRRFVRMQKYLIAIIEKRNTRFLFPHQYFDVLFQIIKLINGRGNLSTHLRKKLAKSLKIDLAISSTTYTPFDMLGVKERRNILFCAYWLLLDWPDRFVNFCKENRIWSTFLLKDFEEAPFWFYSVVYSNLFISNINRKFIGVRHLFSYYG